MRKPIMLANSGAYTTLSIKVMKHAIILLDSKQTVLTIL